MDIDKIDRCMQAYVENQEISGAALIVRRGEEILYKNKWGYSRIEDGKPIAYNSIFRMMSMTKCVTAVCILKLMEAGKLSLEDPVSKYIPQFRDVKVSCDERYFFTPEKLKKIPFYLLSFKAEKVKCEALKRQITIKDLLSHSSGIEQGMVGILEMLKMKKSHKSLQERVMYYADIPTGFQPGTDTGYSPLGGFDILGYVIELVSGRNFEEYLQTQVCRPLEMKDTAFFLNEEQKSRLVDVYIRKKNSLVNVTGSKKDMAAALRQKDGIRFEQGCGGLFSTVEDYEHLTDMLLHKGVYAGRRFLREETVLLMQEEASENHLEPDPGMVWGLSVKIRKEPEKSGSFATAGTYGWSGAFGTHFFVSPQDNLEAVFVTNRADLNGSGSYISQKIEELVYSLSVGTERRAYAGSGSENKP